MTYRTKAIYRGGVFVPETQCDLPEGAEAEVQVQGPSLAPPTITDPEQRARVLRQITERMMQNPIPADAPRFTRDELHSDSPKGL